MYAFTVLVCDIFWSATFYKNRFILVGLNEVILINLVILKVS